MISCIFLNDILHLAIGPEEKLRINVGTEDLVAMNAETIIFWDVMLCSLMESY